MKKRNNANFTYHLRIKLQKYKFIPLPAHMFVTAFLIWQPLAARQERMIEKDR
ncbi:MAG TPA: hypothetical protein PKD52_10965 [Clostridiales bacterium]|nr:hypothetical protein [Clostridiales bacterium]